MDEEKKCFTKKWIGTNMNILHVLGCDMWGNASILYRIYSWIIYIVCIEQTIACGIVLYLDGAEGLERFSVRMNLFCGNLMAACKIMSVAAKREVFHSLGEQLEKNYNHFKGTSFESTFIGTIKKWDKISVFFIIFVGIAAFMCPVMAQRVFINSAAAKISRDSNVTSQVRKLPYEIYYPFDWEPSPNYEILTTYEVINFIYFGTRSTAPDIFCWVLTVHICLQLRALNMMLKTLKNHHFTQISEVKNQCMEENNVKCENFLIQTLEHRSENIVVQEAYTSEKNKNEKLQATYTDTDETFREYEFKNVFGKIEDKDSFEKGLILCIAFHQDVIRFTKDSENALAISNLAHFVGYTALLAFTLVNYVVVGITVDSTIEVLIIIFSMLAILYIHCFYGEHVITWTKKVNESFYDLQWYAQSPRYRKLCLMPLLATQNINKFNGGPFYTISLEAFLKVVNGAYGYFNIMKQLHQQ